MYEIESRENMEAGHFRLSDRQKRADRHDQGALKKGQQFSAVRETPILSVQPVHDRSVVIDFCKRKAGANRFVPAGYAWTYCVRMRPDRDLRFTPAFRWLILSVFAYAIGLWHGAVAPALGSCFNAYEAYSVVCLP